MMSAGDKQVTALRALLTGEFEEYKAMVAALDDLDERRDFMGLVSATLLKLVDRRFAEADLPGAVVEWVGEFRSTSPTAAQAIDPVTAEQVILFTLGMTEAKELSNRQIRDAELFLLPALAHDQQLDRAGIEDLLASARKLAGL